MAAPVSTTETSTSQEVMTFAKQLGIQERLLEMVEITKDVFPAAPHFDVYIENDPDIPGEMFIVFDIRVPHLSLDQASEARELWGKELFQVFSYPRKFLPILRLDFAQ